MRFGPGFGGKIVFFRDFWSKSAGGSANAFSKRHLKINSKFEIQSQIIDRPPLQTGINGFQCGSIPPFGQIRGLAKSRFPITFSTFQITRFGITFFTRDVDHFFYRDVDTFFIAMTENFSKSKNKFDDAETFSKSKSGHR